MTEVVKGIICECGRFEPYSAYVYAHTNILLIFTCEKCDAQYKIRDLVPKLKKHGNTYKRKKAHV